MYIYSHAPVDSRVLKIRANIVRITKLDGQRIPGRCGCYMLRTTVSQDSLFSSNHDLHRARIRCVRASRRTAGAATVRTTTQRSVSHIYHVRISAAVRPTERRLERQPNAYIR